MELLFPDHRPPALRDAVGHLSATDEIERGAVYTKPEVVAAILDLAGYTPERELHALRLLEPSVGAGDFFLPAVDRLLSAYERAGGTASGILSLTTALVGVEVNVPAFQSVKQATLARLVARGVRLRDAELLVESWLVCDDFLLTLLRGEFDFVVGNPPYVRQERIPGVLLEEYRRRYKTIYDRADLYIPFFERGLRVLAPAGRLAFICANRWLKNKYGGPLRELASSNFHLRYFIDMEGTPAFHTEVIAYPAITVFERGPGDATRIARRPEVSAASLSKLAAAMVNGGSASDARVQEIAHAVGGRDPWLLDQPDRLRVLRRLEATFPTLEEAGCKVGIGVATGVDAIFVGKFDELPVEDERKLPLVMAPDLQGVEIDWRGYGVVNPFNPDGSLADLDAFPRFGSYLRSNRQRVANRHCAKKNRDGWYRTIDRIWPDLTYRPKLLIPDIKGEPTVALDDGRFYPHHNLYYVVADDWDLQALATVLRSSVAVLFVSSYCIRMAGGFLRFQAQYLRRIRVPRWRDLTDEQRSGLLAASGSLDLEVIDNAVTTAYGLSADESAIVKAASVEARVPRKNGASPDPSP